MEPIANRSLEQGHLRYFLRGVTRRDSFPLASFAVMVLVAVGLAVSGNRVAALFGATRAAVVMQPQTTLLEATQDTYLNAWEPTQNRGNVRVLKLKGGVYSILLGFDLTPLPPGADVLTATLSIYAYDTEKGFEIGAEVYQVLRPWQEAGANWLSPQAGETWNGPGCTGAGTDRASAPCATATIQGAGKWYAFDVTSEVRSWATGAAQNHGLLVAASPPPPFDTYDFRSREELDNRPKLVIAYSSGSATPTATTTLPGPTLSATPTSTPIQTVQATPTRTTAPSRTPTAIATYIPIRTPVPNSLYPYPEQRVGFVAFGMGLFDPQRLHAGLVKLEDRGPANWERALGFDFCTVLRVGPGYCVPSDPSSWEECRAEIAQLVAANPGHLWFVSNEPENPCRPGWMHSSEYASSYHDVYHFIKEQDPSAQVGIGGVVLPSAIRKEWLQKVLGAFQVMYGEPMPIDVWNIHNLLLSECPGECGQASCGGGYVPREQWPSYGEYFSQADQARAEEFIRLLVGFREWMKDNGFQNKPLIITEMGVLAPTVEGGCPGCFPHVDINQFMYETFEYMMNAADPEIGYPPDGYRLVQRWTWYALGPSLNFNGYLVDWQGQLTDFGLNLANYTARFLPVSPIGIFFQRGWTGYWADCDTTLRPGQSSPGGNSLWVAADGSQRALLRFDLSVLPTNVEVVSATLSVHSSFDSGVGPMTVSCYGIKRPWNIFDATWANATQTSQWEVPGCDGPSDREPTPVGSVVLASGNTWYRFDVSELARSWVADPTANHGVVLKGSAAGSGYWTFVSSDQAEDPPQWKHRLRPKLELLVSLPGPTPTPSPTPTVTGTLIATPTRTMTPTPTATGIVATYTIYIPIILKGA
jgi:hypothetical protein